MNRVESGLPKVVKKIWVHLRQNKFRWRDFFIYIFQSLQFYSAWCSRVLWTLQPWLEGEYIFKPARGERQRRGVYSRGPRTRSSRRRVEGSNEQTTALMRITSPADHIHAIRCVFAWTKNFTYSQKSIIYLYCFQTVKSAVYFTAS